MAKRICKIYRCSKKDEMYLYVDTLEDLSRVPEALIGQMGKLTLVMTMLITSEKSLHRADANKVLSDIEERGFYLQMPPPPEEYMQMAKNDG